MPEPTAINIPPIAPIPETTWERIRRLLGKLVVHFFPHRSKAGRIIRTRLCKRPPVEEMIASEIIRSRNQIRDFVPDTDVLVLGSSHTLYAIFPSPNDALRLWNCGIVNGDLYQARNVYAAIEADGRQLILSRPPLHADPLASVPNRPPGATSKHPAAKAPEPICPVTSSVGTFQESRRKAKRGEWVQQEPSAPLRGPLRVSGWTTIGSRPRPL